MKRFKIEQSTREITATSGLALIGQAIRRYTNLASNLDKQVPLRHGIAHSDVVKSYLGLLCIGKNDKEKRPVKINSSHCSGNMQVICVRPARASPPLDK